MKEVIKKNWDVTDIPTQVGKLAVITGATGGLGFETALALAHAGAEVILAGRNESKGADALRRIKASWPGTKVHFERVDLASLASIHALADRLLARGRGIDILVNNAAVMATPTHQKTEDGFELQFGTNYLSHFALTARLLPLLTQNRDARVVSVSSGAHKMGKKKIDFDDLQSDRKYSPFDAYCQSKLAMLLFAFELQRQSDAHGWGLLSYAAHPGFARTDIITNGPGKDSLLSRLSKVIGVFLSQSAAAGALPIVYAATASEARAAGYYGPQNRFEMKGPVAPAIIDRAAKDESAAKRLWDVSERLTRTMWVTVDNATDNMNRTITGAVR